MWVWGVSDTQRVPIQTEDLVARKGECPVAEIWQSVVRLIRWASHATGQQMRA